MDDIGKAFIMGVNVLLFIMALTISVLMYYGLMSHIDGIMLSSDYSNRGDSIVDVREVNTRRQVRRAEIITGILALPQNTSSTIVVGGKTFTSDGNSIFINGVACEPNSSVLRTQFINILGSLSAVASNTYTLTVTNNASGTRSKLVYTLN